MHSQCISKFWIQLAENMQIESPFVIKNTYRMNAIRNSDIEGYNLTIIVSQHKYIFEHNIKIMIGFNMW